MKINKSFIYINKNKLFSYNHYPKKTAKIIRNALLQRWSQVVIGWFWSAIDTYFPLLAGNKADTAVLLLLTAELAKL